MVLDAIEELAAGYVLGTLSAGERAIARDLEAANADFARQVSAWEARLAPLAASGEAEPPPAGLFAAVEQRVDEAKAELPSTITLRGATRQWVKMAEGVDVSVLWQSPALKRQSVLIRMAPNVHYDSHEHADDEECLVIEGDLQFGELKLGAGDYHFAPKGRTHPPAYSRGGCLLFVTTAL